MTPLEITAEQHPGQTRVVLIGELDIDSTGGFEEQLAAVEGDSPSILVLDLRRVEFVDSTGLRAVIAADENYRAAFAKNKEGLINILEVINAEVQLINAQVQQVQAIYDYHIADAQLLRDIGLNDPIFLPRVPGARPPVPPRP